MATIQNGYMTEIVIGSKFKVAADAILKTHKLP